MRRNICHTLNNPNDARVTFHQSPDFDVRQAILLGPKRQPDTYLQENFEEENESKLLPLTGDIVIIKDK